MKRRTKITLAVVTAGLAFASASAVVVAKEKMRGHNAVMMAEGGHHGNGNQGRYGAMRQQMTKLFNEHDANKDGAVTQDEVDGVRKATLDKFDTDKDGNLSLAEFERLWLERMKSRMVDSFQRLDDDGSGTITTDEFIAPFGSIIKSHDMDNDGDVDEEELSKHMQGRGKGRKGQDHDHDHDRGERHHNRDRG
ncbi:MAG: EF-hand domain-containing protein [Rhodospirillales bacterium]|nr:EF-hand domain-containing protein [Rhodospirillales bacterium]